MLSTTIKRRALPALRLARAPTHVVSRRPYHVENRLGNNFPFAYDGPSKTRFTIAYWGLLGGVGFLGIPGLALWLQMGKHNGQL
ncbi:hypothetical protein Rhopal_004116-T1 [Rhodotorula paludigena]|uniref:Cytochrome c oxidase subunit 8, mitochondrial n=1 Tax=Rhodotorula paludigena TaxID=86838 RepID=A0AAV5GPB6_9BASI|nr:hypothetical protein Rhopal_004116-T1 [Rhodotorula paludigena]